MVDVVFPSTQTRRRSQWTQGSRRLLRRHQRQSRNSRTSGHKGQHIESRLQNKLGMSRLGPIQTKMPMQKHSRCIFAAGLLMDLRETFNRLRFFCKSPIVLGVDCLKYLVVLTSRTLSLVTLRLSPPARLLRLFSSSS